VERFAATLTKLSLIFVRRATFAAVYHPESLGNPRSPLINRFQEIIYS
jgi:hypothetical protein